jgi:DNA-binding beta-propeller fold protein YncE
MTDPNAPEWKIGSDAAGAEEAFKAISSIKAGKPRIAFSLARELGRDLAPPMTLPSAVALGHDGTIYALDRPETGGFRLTAFGAQSDAGRVVCTFAYGKGDGELADPAGLAVDHEGLVYVSDLVADGVKKFGPDGAWLGTFVSAGFDGSRFKGPRGVAVDPGGNLYVADTNNDRLVKLLPDGELGWTLDTFGEDESFYEPYAVSVVGKRVAVADTNENRVLVFDGDRLVCRLGKERGFVFPTAVKLSADGKLLYVADRGNLRARRFEVGGKQTGEVILTESETRVAENGSGMEADAEGRLVLIQPFRGSVVVVRFPPG